ncbi:hypothetical protein U0070_019550 [Myodes glareolus]|uniref:Uncharacterized protein n=1 Tax=Myodes glareolus TaxID=447135 RepID=A0AAW0JNJ6_MYOGA
MHRVKAGVGGCELLHRAVQLLQEKPGGVRIYFHQVEEDAVERGLHEQGRTGTISQAAAAVPSRDVFIWAAAEGPRPSSGTGPLCLQAQSITTLIPETPLAG